MKSDFKHMELLLQMAIPLYQFCFEKGQSIYSPQAVLSDIIDKRSMTQTLHVPLHANQLLE